MMKCFRTAGAAFFLAASGLSGCFSAAPVSTPGYPDFSSLNLIREEKISRLAEQEKTLPAPEQIRRSQEAGKQINAARRLIWDGKYTEAASALNRLLTSPGPDPSQRSAIPVLLVDLLLKKKDFKAVPDTVDSYLKQNRLPSHACAALLRQKAAAFEQMKKFPEQLRTLLERLKEALPEEEVKRTRLDVIAACERMHDLPLAIRYARESLRNPALTEKDEIALRDRLTSLCRAAKKIPETLAETEKLFRLLTHPDDRARVLLANSNLLFTEKRKPEAEKIRLAVLTGPDVSFPFRWQAFRLLADSIRNSGQDKRQIIALANRTLLKQKRSPDEFGTIALYLMDLSAGVLRDAGSARKYAESLLAFPGVPNQFKIKASRRLAIQAMNEEKFDEARDILSRALVFPGIQDGERLELYRAIAETYTAGFECDKAVHFLRSKQTPENAAQISDAVAKIYCLFLRFNEAAGEYLKTGRPDKAAAVWSDAAPEKSKEIARRFISDEKLPDSIRREGIRYFLGNSAEDQAVRKKYPHYVDFAAGSGILLARVRDAVTCGEWELALEYLDILSRQERSFSFELASWRILVCAASGKFDRAARLAEHDAEMEKFTPEQRRSIAFTGSVPALPDKTGEFEKYCAASPVLNGRRLSSKERAELLLKAANLALNARKSILAEEAFQTYQSLFKPQTQKTYHVEFSGEPVRGLAGFLALKHPPEIQNLDRKSGGDLDFLTTDVSTGDRGSGIGSASGETCRPADFQALCDARGLHFLFTAYDPAAPEIEAGLAPAGSYEMYLAPGEGQPYICLLPNAAERSCQVWNTTYDNAFWHRPGAEDVTCEFAFGKDLCRFYLFLSWEKFYDKLPEEGDLWDFETIRWSRFGGNSWNGTRSIHGRSSWGKLAFRITKNQMTEIKRRILFAARKNYLAEKTTTGHIHGIISFWKDPVLGDPEFFRERLEPAVKKLDSFLPLVKAGMDPGTVEKVFLEAVPGWANIRFLVSGLRRQYLEERLSE